ncbi:hypothetical protein D3C81_1674620 [compost metagenome]
MRDRFAPQGAVRATHMQKLVALYPLHRMKLVIRQCPPLLLNQIAHFRPVAEHHAQAPQLLHL